MKPEQKSNAPNNSDIEKLLGPGVQVWIPHEIDGYELFTFCGKTDTVYQLTNTNGEKKDFPIKETSLLLANDASQQPSDLTQLTNLNEATILSALAYRYSHNAIYTYSGIVLVALNPFKALPIYSDVIAYNYSTKEMPDPHIFAVAHSSLNGLNAGKSQSVIVSGESGAGKTISAKYIMKFFSRSSTEKKTATDGEGSVEDRVLATNPIMEAFGNAKTERNNNSSRFGKFIQVFPYILLF
jgi:myosin-5